MKLNGVDLEETFSELYEAQWLGLVRLATLTTGSRALAEEIVQDAFASLYRRWSAVEHPAAYVRLAVVHGCTDWVRHRQVENRPANTYQRPEEHEPVGALDDVLRTLTPRQRAAVVLRFYEDWSEEAIAKALRCRKGTVKSLLHRAVDQLRKELSE